MNKIGLITIFLEIEDKTVFLLNAYSLWIETVSMD